MTLMLLFHIGGGIAMALAAAYAVYVLLRRVAERYRAAALWLGVLAVFEIGTGTLLAIFSESISVAVVCERIAIYMAGATLLESVLFMRIRRGSVRFPAPVIPGVSVSAAVLFTAFVLGF